MTPPPPPPPPQKLPSKGVQMNRDGTLQVRLTSNKKTFAQLNRPLSTRP